jgi:hypothetical protein
MSEDQQRQMRDEIERKKQESRARSEENQLDAHERPPDEKSPRAKSSRHGKVTADKWNQ